jgi:hypothetical protein
MANRNPTANVTTLSGDIDGASNNDSYHVVYLYRLPITALLDGFTLSGSNANGTSNIKKLAAASTTTAPVPATAVIRPLLTVPLKTAMRREEPEY